MSEFKDSVCPVCHGIYGMKLHYPVPPDKVITGKTVKTGKTGQASYYQKVTIIEGSYNP